MIHWDPSASPQRLGLAAGQGVLTSQRSGFRVENTRKLGPKEGR